MVRTEFELPDVGEGVAEGELVTWLVDTDEHVEEDQPIAEVETDKALVEIPSAYDGVIVERRAEEGETVPVGDVLVVFDVDGESADDADAGGATDGSDSAEAVPDPSGPSESVELGVGDGPSLPDGRVFAPPSVRNVARELGVSLEAVERAGSGDRITERDVRETARGDAGDVSGGSDSSSVAVEQGADASTVAGIERDESEQANGQSASASLEAADRERTLAMPATRQLAREEGVSLDAVPASERRDGEPFVTPEDVRAFSRGDGPAATPSSAPETPSRADTDDERPGDRIPYSGVRKTIGEQMATSKYTAP
ncbi:biotin/lipoyl-containing protein, partial [Halostagnicola sp. A-GB9-2]|uniref:biotin/lipoyl-containing protein n=1 Tax=Halostagnicola sp. A-GB9-2 TaxID=3048066 RepID=UPI0024C08246